MRAFNTAGTCRPKEHYMVDITERLEIIRKMIAKGDYFCINRGRQYGKTTTLAALDNLIAPSASVLKGWNGIRSYYFNNFVTIPKENSHTHNMLRLAYAL